MHSEKIKAIVAALADTGRKVSGIGVVTGGPTVKVFVGDHMFEAATVDAAFDAAMEWVRS